jgi:disulfide bond formation protein DsbB
LQGGKLAGSSKTLFQNMVAEHGFSIFQHVSACFSQCWAQREAFFRTGQKSLDNSHAHNILGSKLFAPSMWFREVNRGVGQTCCNEPLVSDWVS